MALPWAQQRSWQLRPSGSVGPARSVGGKTSTYRRLSAAKRSAVRKVDGKQRGAQEVGAASSPFLGRSAGLGQSNKKESGKICASYGLPLVETRRSSSVIARAKVQPMPQGTVVRNTPFRKPKKTPSNLEYLDDEGWGTEEGPEAFLVESEGSSRDDDDDNGASVKKLVREFSLDSLAEEDSDDNEESSFDKQDRVLLPQRPRRVMREITPQGKLKDEAEAEHRRNMEAAGKTGRTAFGFHPPKIAERLTPLEDAEEYEGKPLEVERVPGARRKAVEEEALPPKAQTKEDFDRLYEEYLHREKEKRIEEKRQKEIFNEERKERIKMIEVERQKRKSDLAKMGIAENKKHEIPSDTIERIQRLKGKEKRQAWVGAWKRVRKMEMKEKNKIKQSKAALQKEAEEYLNIAMQKLIGADITRVRGRTAMDIIANTMAGRLGDALPSRQRSMLEEIPPLPLNYRTVEEKAQNVFTSTYVEQFRPSASGTGLKTVVTPFREADRELSAELGLPSANLENVASSSSLFGRGFEDRVDDDLQERIAADLARLENEVQQELQGAPESSGSRGGNVQPVNDERGVNETVSVTNLEPQRVFRKDDDSDDRKDDEEKDRQQPETVDDDSSDSDDIKKVGEELFPDFDGSAVDLVTSSLEEVTSSSDGDDIREIGEELFPEFREESSSEQISKMGKVMSKEIRQVVPGYVGMQEVETLDKTMPEAKHLNHFLQTLSFKTAEIEARIRKASAEQAIRVAKKKSVEKNQYDQQRRKELIAKGGGDFWEAAGKYPAGPKGETFATAYQKARVQAVPAGVAGWPSALRPSISETAESSTNELAPVEDFQVPAGKTVIKVGQNECLECEGVNKDGSRCVRLVTIKDVARYGGRIMCWQHR